MGCLVRKLFWIALLVGAIAAGWWLRSRWTGDGRTDAAASRELPWEWQTLSEARAAKGRTEIGRLGRPNGPLLVKLEPGDLGSVVLVQIARELPPSADSIQAAVIGDLYHVRASVKPSELGGAEVLGALGGFLGEREPIQFGGTFHLIRPGLAEYRVRQIRLRQFMVPEAMLPRLMSRVRRGAPVEGLSPTGLPLEVPPYLGDVRIADGSVTLYKDVE